LQGRLPPHCEPAVSKLTWHDRHALTTQLHFPFLSCQWKSQKGGEGHCHASLQGARVGAAIVRSLLDLCQTAQHTPSIVDTAHFSLTTETDTAKLWVHWLESREDGGADYHMELINQAFWRPLTPRDTGMIDMRKMLRNILEYAVSTRLDNIKAAIASLPPPRLRMGCPKRTQSKKPMSSSDTLSNSATLVGHPLATAPSLKDAPLSSNSPTLRLCVSSTSSRSGNSPRSGLATVPGLSTLAASATATLSAGS
jgi:hypothetical protein